MILYTSCTYNDDYYTATIIISCGNACANWWLASRIILLFCTIIIIDAYIYARPESVRVPVTPPPPPLFRFVFSVTAYETTRDVCISNISNIFHSTGTLWTEDVLIGWRYRSFLFCFDIVRHFSCNKNHRSTAVLISTNIIRELRGYLYYIQNQKVSSLKIKTWSKFFNFLKSNKIHFNCIFT